MSTATLNVWVTAVGEPCKIDNEHQWFVHILHCNGEVLQWCDRKYVNLPTECAHLEVEIPPGCYMVVATWSPAHGGATVPQSLGNHISHLAVVRAKCGDHVCVTLFPPTYHNCGIWWVIATRELMAFKAIDANAGEEAIAAIERVLEQVPADPFTRRIMEIGELQETVAQEADQAE